MQHTTGFTKDEIYALCGLVRRETADAQETVWPPILGLFKAVVVTLTYLRRNRVQAELAETFGVSQPTISRAISGLTPVLVRQSHFADLGGKIGTRSDLRKIYVGVSA